MMRSLAVFARFLILALFALSLGGCGLLPEQVDETAGWSAQKLYGEAKDAMNQDDWEKAIKYYEKLEARYPYGRFAQQAQMEIAYSYWKSGEPASALAACDRFIKLHPNHPNVDYIYYLKGLVNFNEDQGLLALISQQDPSERDPKAAKEAFDSFRELAERFPNSKYTPDAIQRMNWLVNAMSAQEVSVARYYVKRNAYLAAANRAQEAIRNYPNTPALEEALYIMVVSYDNLGLTQLRDDAHRVLEKNYPQSKFLAANYQEEKRPWYHLWW
jgi:outer membrane protein assembly factor BamD